MEELTRLVAELDADERFALMQLCSTAYLASGRLSDDACARLARAGLAWKHQDGFWAATDKGRSLFRRLDSESSRGRRRVEGSGRWLQP